MRSAAGGGRSNDGHTRKICKTPIETIRERLEAKLAVGQMIHGATGAKHGERQ